jgi:enoyl-CoA hydratase/carnithine racemase
MMAEKVIIVPQSLNASAVANLASVIESAMGDEGVRAVVLRGSNEAFCRGLDLDELVGNADGEPLEAQPVLDYCRCLRALRFSDKPAIAVVEGEAFGGGIGLVATCDIVIASETSKFGLPEVLFGLAPAMVMPFLLERIPIRTARIWAMTANARSAAEAHAAGLVDVLVSEANLDKELRRQLKALKRSVRQGVATIKHLTAVVPSLDLAAALELGQRTTLSALRDSTTVAAIRRYRNEGIMPWEAP